MYFVLMALREKLKNTHFSNAPQQREKFIFQFFILIVSQNLGMMRIDYWLDASEVSIGLQHFFVIYVSLLNQFFSWISRYFPRSYDYY